MDPKFLDFQVPQISKFLNFQAPRSPNSQISKFPDFQVARFPDAADDGAGGAGRTLRSQPDPSPNAPGDQMRRKVPFPMVGQWSLFTRFGEIFQLTACC